MRAGGSPLRSVSQSPGAIEPFEGRPPSGRDRARHFHDGGPSRAADHPLRFGTWIPPRQAFVPWVVAGFPLWELSGIPTMGGTYFDSCYEGNPLVNALCAGILRHEDIQKGAATGVGNPVYYAGPGTGRDGLGGASFASRELTEESARPTCGAKGGSIHGKTFAGGLSGNDGHSGFGGWHSGGGGRRFDLLDLRDRFPWRIRIEIDLDLVPQRESGMNSYEIMLSESQERLLVIVKRGRERGWRSVREMGLARLGSERSRKGIAW